MKDKEEINATLTAEFNKAYGTSYYEGALKFTTPKSHKNHRHPVIYVSLYLAKPDEWEDFYYVMTYRNRQTYGGVASRHRKGFRISPLTRKWLEEEFNLY